MFLKTDDEFAAFPQRAGDLDRSLMHLHQPLYEGQSDAQPSLGTLTGPFRLRKQFKYSRLEFRRVNFAETQWVRDALLGSATAAA